MGANSETFRKWQSGKIVIAFALLLPILCSFVVKLPANDQPIVFPEKSEINSTSGLDVEIILNQTAYLPNSHANITLKLYNNHTTSLTSVNLSAVLPEEMQLIEGTNSIQNQIVNSGENLTHSFICNIPDQVASLDLVFLIDSSGSMSEELNEVKDEVRSLIEAIEPLVSSLRIGFIIFGSSLFSQNPDDDARNILDLTTNGDAINLFIDQFSASGSWEPWGDAIYLLQTLNWESTGKLAILITDEPCNGGYYVGDGSHDYYFGLELEQTVQQIHELGIIISTMQAYGGGSDLTEQLQMVASVGGGSFVELSQSSSELIEQAIVMAEEVIAELGLKIVAQFEAILDEEVKYEEVTKWVLVDNLPPSLVGSAIPYFVNEGDGISIRYKIICSVFDASGVTEVSLFYRNDTGSFLPTLMTQVASNIFEFQLPKQDEGTIVEYYFSASDILGTSTVTNVSSFEVDYSLPELGLGDLNPISLSPETYMIYMINETIINETILGVFSQSKLNFQLYESESNSLVNHGLINYSYPFYNVKFNEDFDGYLLLQNPADYISTGTIFFDIVDSEIDLSIQEEEEFQETIEFNEPLIYKVTNIDSDATWIHIMIESENEFQFLGLLCFSGDLYLKHNVFNALSVECEDLEDAYFVILPTDSRIDSSMSSTISIGYGYIEDEPYWGPEVAIPGYNLFIIIGVITLTSMIIILKKHKEG